MTYVDSLSGALADIGQIQATLASLPAAPGAGGFEAVMQQISGISTVTGRPGAGAPDLSGSYGWPMEEGALLPGGTAAADGPMITAGSTTPTSGAVYATTPGPSSLSAGDLEAAPLETSPGALSGPGAAAGSTPSADLGQEAVSGAQKFLGVPYLWGGTNPAQGVDCSGLVQDVYSGLGINLPRTSQEQATTGVAVPSVADAQPGDLVFFPGADGTASAPGHVGIYIGNGQMIDAPYTGAVVRVDPVGDPTAIRRVTGLAGPAPATSGLPGPAGGPTTGPASYAASGASSAGRPNPDAPAMAASPSAYQPDLAGAAQAYGVPEQLLAAVADTESGFQPGAVSGAGAEGLMQLMPTTASSLGVNPFNPAQAITGAAKLLSSYRNQYGSWSLALAAYNAGPGAVDRYSGIPPYPETQAYVSNVLSRAGMEGQ